MGQVITLTPEQKKSVSEWVAAGDNLYTVQKKLADQLKVSMTYMDVRFLVDDLNLEIKDPAPKADASDVSKTPAPKPGAPEKKGFIDKAKEKLGLAMEEDEAVADEALPAGGVTVSVDKVSLNPAAMASGTVTFPDGVTGRWMVDLQGRPGITEVSKPGYRPSPTDAQAFMQELSLALQHI
jgi:hypothetical protein